MTVEDHKVTDYPILSSAKVWEGRVFGMQEDLVRLPGTPTPVLRQYIDHPGAVAVVVMRGTKVLLLEQYRHPVRAKLWEIPAGLLDIDGERYVDAARRELREEADLEGGEWSVLVDLFSSPGCTSESLRVFLARDPVDCSEPFPREDEELEMRPVWVDLDEAVQAVLRGDLHNATAATGILAAAVARKAGWDSLRSVDTPWTR